ncbi:efflux RND transporter periplasmic adaptor subunit [Sphingobium sufflavum]|uniref:efflux RND transporter periplasmic adaptor subunit n=1 Tax=Sphingobium sufflavum TaxID=1129547 RepID=UPI001F417C08|nr:efflux RND transporter periplasmic adaptor subunit [Sphingobium sufflavum]MCE7797194.1 efflux RND transporter periplasmic adaptor subunit [Sphingobium sufflavum]
MYLSKVKADSSAEQDSAAGQARWKKAYLILPVIGLALVYLLMRWFGAAPAPAAPPPASVTVSHPLSRMVTDWDDYVGRFEASKAVEVRPRVSGQLVGIHFKDGDVVQKGQLLFTIDPRPFTAVLDQSQAQAAAAATTVNLARAELARASRLIADQAVSAEEIDTLRARVQSGQAQLAAAQATVRAQRLNVEFAHIRAPITGRISDRRVDVGNLVAGDTAAGATVMTTINALDPIYFSFNGSEALLLKHQRQKDAAGQVEIRLQDEAEYKWKGHVDFTDNAIDNGSGTIRGRAVVANAGGFLVPGMFGNMRLNGGAPHRALLVPDGAVVTDQARKIVYVVAKDGTVAVRPVEVGALAGGLRVIRSGITAQDEVVIQGTQFAMPGAKVNKIAGRIDPAKVAAVAPVAAPASSQATITN